MMLWCNFDHHLLSLAALLVIVSCGGGEQRRGTDSSSTSSTGGGSGSSSSSSSSGSGSNNYSNRRFHKIQHGQCTYTFILPEGDGARGGSCREGKAGSAQQNANSLQRDAPPPEPEFPSQKIQQLEHIMENYTLWLQKVRNRRVILQKYRLFIYLLLKSRNAVVEFVCFFLNQIYIWNALPCMFSNIAQERTSFEAVALSFHICWDICVFPSGVWSPRSVLFAASRDNSFGFPDAALRLNLGRVCCFLSGRHVVCQSVCQKGGFYGFRCGGLFFFPCEPVSQRDVTENRAQRKNWNDCRGIFSVNRQKRDSATGFITPPLCCYITPYVIRIELSVLDVTQLDIADRLGLRLPRSLVWFFFFSPPNFLSASPWQTTRWVNSTDVRLSCAARRSQSRGSYMSVTPCSPVGCLFNGRKSERVPGDGWLRKRQGKRMLPLFIYSSQGRASRAWKPRLAGKQKSETCLTSPTIIIVNELMGTVYLQSHWSVSYAGIWFQCNVNKLQILRPSLIQLIRLWQALCFSKLWDFVSPKGARLSRRKRIHESNKQTSSVRHDRLSSSSTFHNIIVLKWN